MSADTSQQRTKTALIVGASRGLGHAIAAEFLKRQWQVIGTVRGEKRTPLHELAAKSDGRLQIAALDINVPEQVASLRNRLADSALDLLFVNAGTTTHDEHVRIGDVSTEEFVRVMMTNALSPMRVVEALHDLVAPEGLIGAMSSGQGSITNNENGTREVYRGSKAALNMFMRSFAARQENKQRAVALMAPGWIRTELGGPDAPFTIEDTVPVLVDVLISRLGSSGIHFLDRFGKSVPW